MSIWKQSFGMGIALWITACSSTSLRVGRDAAVEVKPAIDAMVDQDTLVPVPDATTVFPDAGIPVPDLGTIIQAPDTAAPVPDTAVVVPDTAAVVPDTATAPLDTARATLDTRETAANPYANRTFRIGPENPAPTPDATCTQYGPSDYFQLSFGADTTTVNVLMVSGSAAQSFQATVGPESNKLTYHVTGFLAGGIITFEQDQGIQVAQVILYGSGVPIVRCLRGAMTPQP